MENELNSFNGADYTRVPLPQGHGTDDLVSPLAEQLRRVRVWAEEEDERRKRHRARIARDAQIPVGGLRDLVTGPAEDTAVADGLSLNIGSEAHETYVRERKGMDQFELRRANLAELGFGRPEDFEAPPDDQFHLERSEKLAEQEGDILARELSYDETRSDTRRQRAQRRMNKQIQAEAIMDMAADMADDTPTSADDEFVHEDLPEIMDSFISNDTVASLDGEAARTSRVIDAIQEEAEKVEELSL